MRNRAPLHPTNDQLYRAPRYIDADSKTGMSCSLVAQRNLFLALSGCLGFILVVVWVNPSGICSSPSTSISNLRDTGRCQMTFGEYRGHEYSNVKSGTVGKPKCLVESKWLKLSQHSVKLPGSNSVLDDWMWIDYHDRINVLVEAESKPGGETERQFLVFEQSKYALEGRMSLAVIGGIIEPGEQAEVAARREVEEELNGMKCQDFHFLGRFRTDVNRGMGWVNGFLATTCSRHGSKHHQHLSIEGEVGAADTERQDLKRVTLTELKDAVRRGEFLEVQWSATVALALLHPEMML
jgi:8-oxo-dGTP pyrophosphatase MutT (NUDIX family)